MIRKVSLNDAKEIVDIYNYYVMNTNITFEEEKISEDEMKNRIKEKLEHNNPWIVYEEDGEILGYAYIGVWRDRAAYKYSKESTIYLRNGVNNRGIGSKLYGELIKLSKASNVHTIIASITVPNEASFKLHEKFGFKKMTEYKEVGYKNGEWLDVAFFQLML